MSKKIKFKQEVVKNGIWTDWILPIMNNYHMKCCDCGLVHTINFIAVKTEKSNKTGGGTFTFEDKKKYRIMFKIRRNEKLTRSSK